MMAQADYAINIGTYNGASVLALASAMHLMGQPARHVTTIDIHHGRWTTTQTAFRAPFLKRGIQLEQINSIERDFKAVDPDPLLGDTAKYMVFYDIHDLEDKTGKPNDDLPDVIAKWRLWNRGDCTAKTPKAFADRTQKAFIVPRKDIAKSDYDLSVGRYRESEHEQVEYENPKQLLKRLKKLEDDISDGLEQLEGMIA